MVLNRHFPVGAANTAQTTRRTFDTTILEVESTSYRSFAPYLCSERGFEPVFLDMMTQQCGLECISLSISNPAIGSLTGVGRHTAPVAGLHGDGLLEMIAAAVLLLHRETGYDSMVEQSALVECHVVKNRHGPCTHPSNPTRLVFPIARFSDLP